MPPQPQSDSDQLIKPTLPTDVMDVVSAAKGGGCSGLGASSSSTSAHQHMITSTTPPHLPPGFRFHPTDEELVVYYLRPKASSFPLPAPVIAEIDLYKHDPWELPAKSCGSGGNVDTAAAGEWYFFSPRDRKYPNGARPNRAATSGYWKATGTDKAIYGSSSSGSSGAGCGGGGGRRGVVGVKKALVFYGGKPPRGVKTNWIMHEYRLVDSTKPPVAAAGGGSGGKKKNSLRLDDWVLCRIYQKNTTQRPLDHDGSPELRGGPPPPSATYTIPAPQQQQDRGSAPPSAGFLFQLAAASSSQANYSGALLGNDETFFEGLLAHNDHDHAELSLATMPSNRGASWQHDYQGAATATHGDLKLDRSSEGNAVLGQAGSPEYQTLLGAMGDGVIRQTHQFQLSRVNNWNA